LLILTCSRSRKTFPSSITAYPMSTAHTMSSVCNTKEVTNAD
jgi:hypothetical protein